MAAVEWVENRLGIEEYLEFDPELNETLHLEVENAADYARSIAPVGSPADDDKHPGLYRDSITAEKMENSPGWEVVSHDNKAWWIEYGAAHMPRYGVLTRALEQIRGNLG